LKPPARAHEKSKENPRFHVSNAGNEIEHIGRGESVEKMRMRKKGNDEVDLQTGLEVPFQLTPFSPNCTLPASLLYWCERWLDQGRTRKHSHVLPVHATRN
jgi:hypothetical protein